MPLLPPNDIEDLSTVMYFLLYLKKEQPDSRWGGYEVDRAWNAFCRLHMPCADPAEVERLLAEELHI